MATGQQKTDVHEIEGPGDAGCSSRGAKDVLEARRRSSFVLTMVLYLLVSGQLWIERTNCTDRHPERPREFWSSAHGGMAKSCGF